MPTRPPKAPKPITPQKVQAVQSPISCREIVTILTDAGFPEATRSLGTRGQHNGRWTAGFRVCDWSLHRIWIDYQKGWMPVDITERLPILEQYADTLSSAGIHSEIRDGAVWVPVDQTQVTGET